MNWEAAGAIGEILGSIAVFITLIYLAIQVQQNTRHVRAQMGHDGWLATTASEIALMGDDPAEALAKLELGDEALTSRELKVADAYFRSLLMQMGRVEHMNSLGLEIYTAEQTADAFVDLFNNPVGIAWWEINRELVEVFAPEIAAQIEARRAEPGCRSRATSLQELRRRLAAEAAP